MRHYHPRYGVYALVNAHTGEEFDTYGSRAEANAAKNTKELSAEWQWRVRGKA